MAKLNLNKYKKGLKNVSWKRVVGIVFLVACLITAVVVTNDTARKFLFGSWAKECRDIGLPRDRQACWAREAEVERLPRGSQALPRGGSAPVGFTGNLLRFFVNIGKGNYSFVKSK